MTITIREAREEDFEEISDLLIETNLADSYFTEDRFKKMLERNKGYCYVAETNGHIIGNAFATHDGAFRGYIQKVAVTEKYRRKEIASKLIKTIIGKLEEAEILLIFALVEKSNDPSIKLLQSLGFEIRESHYLIDLAYKPRKK